MPLTTPNFSVTESLGIPENLTFSDTSVGSDGTLTDRRIYMRLANGNWLTPNGESTTIQYTVWPIVDTSFQMTVLTRSTTANITVEWSDGSSAVYTKTILYCFPLFDYLFAYDLIGNQTSSPGIIQDTNYYSNFSQFIVNLFCAEIAVSTGDDLYSSQGALNRNYQMEQDENLYF